MNLWHSADASRELEATNTGLSVTDVHKQEQDHFDQAVTLYRAKEYEKARKEFRAVVDMNVADSTLKPQAEGYLGKMRQTANEEKLYDTAVQDMKDENWSEARDQFQEVIKRKGPQSSDAKKQLPTVEKALQTVSAVEEAIRGGSFRAAKAQLDSAQHWNKTHDKLLKELHDAEQQQFEQIKSSAQAVESKGDAAGIQRVQDDIHRFEGRAEEASVLAACKDLEKHLNAAYSAAAEKSSDKSAFDAAVAHFEQAKQRGDVGQLNHGVSQEFQKIAGGSGIYREQAALYVKTTIPNTIQGLTKSVGKLVLPALSCGPGHAAPASSVRRRRRLLRAVGCGCAFGMGGDPHGGLSGRGKETREAPVHSYGPGYGGTQRKCEGRQRGQLRQGIFQKNKRCFQTLENDRAKIRRETSDRAVPSNDYVPAVMADL